VHTLLSTVAAIELYVIDRLKKSFPDLAADWPRI
jgi:hypothetical protein